MTRITEAEKDAHDNDIPAGWRVRVRGAVQGVGFRPTVWRIANELGLAGDVANDGEGVLIHAWGGERSLAAFLDRLRAEKPPLATITAIETEPLAGAPAGPRFAIVASSRGRIETSVLPDAATCPACLEEVRDPHNRRWRYPFTNCTHCGPRFSIIRAAPYDRARTSMAAFVQCPRCAAEYGNPADRRFHAQPNACAACGPRLWIEEGSGQDLQPDAGQDAVAVAAALLRRGAILAVKGLGGFHLACDALDGDAVRRLRSRKRRMRKPFALMAEDPGAIARYAEVDDASAALLRSPAAPIVILARRNHGPALALPDAIAPGQNTIGFMLPYTPLHHILLEAVKRPLVMTSGNVTDEPQCIDNEEARRRLGETADYWLMHDREIVNRLDDSVARVIGGRGRMMRRARGHAPAPTALHPDFKPAPPVLAMGGDLKSTFCLIKGDQAILSQHLGDLEDTAVHAEYRKTLDLYRRMFDFAPERIAVDLHPGYFSARWGRDMALQTGLGIEPVQHHHAHVAACLAEYGAAPDCRPVLGVVLDGSGFGEDGTLWGGEFLLAGFRSFRRLAHFAPIPLPGGARAAREPWRNLYAHLVRSLGWERAATDFARAPGVAQLGEKPLAVLDVMMERRVNAPLASSAGRLFDAAAAAVGVATGVMDYEGEAAMALETLAWEAADEEGGYGHEVGTSGEARVIGWTPLWRGLLTDLDRGVAPAVAAARFHNTLARAIGEEAEALASRHDVETIVLSGGVMQNRMLAERTIAALEGRGMTVLVPERVPAGDGGLALGQGAVAAARALFNR